MAINLPTPLTTPTGPGFKSCSLQSKVFGMSHELNGAAIVTVKTVGQQWIINITYNTMTHEQYLPLGNVLDTIGNMDQVEVVLPQYRQLGNAARGVTSGAAGSTSVLMDNALPPSYVGMFVKFDNGPKVYKILSFAGSTITLNTGLYTALTAASIAQFTDIEFTCKLSASPTINTNENNLVEGFTLQMKETTI